MYYDSTMILLIPAIALSLYAQYKVSSCFSKYSKCDNKRGYTGADVARQLLMLSNITDVEVRAVPGNLTDNYDPRNKTLNLSESVYNSRSISAIGVAAHETGHAIQHSEAYAPLSIRSSIFPVVNISSKCAMPLIMLGLMFGMGGNLFLNIGIVMFAVIVLFQVITLPVELNASSRAVRLLHENNFVSDDEVTPIKKVLGAAALTYIASAAVSLINLLRFIMIAQRRR